MNEPNLPLPNASEPKPGSESTPGPESVLASAPEPESGSNPEPEPEIVKWKESSFTCVTCERLMYFCSHCRICGRAVCTACIESRPVRWFATACIDTYPDMPKGVTVMKTCPACGEQCEAKELEAMQTDRVIPLLLQRKVHTCEWLHEVKDIEPQEVAQAACRALLVRHAELAACKRFACDNYPPVTSKDRDLMEADPMVHPWDIIHSTPKYKHSSEPIDVPLFLFVSLLARPASRRALVDFACVYPKHVSTVFELLHHSTRDACVKKLAPTPATVLLQWGVDLGNLYPNRTRHIGTMRNILEYLQTQLCLDLTPSALVRVRNAYLSTRPSVTVKGRIHYVDGVSFFPTDPSSMPRSAAVACSPEAPSRHSPRVKIQCTDNRTFHACFGSISNLYLHAAALYRDAVYGRHFRNTFRIATDRVCLVFEGRDFRSGKQSIAALDNATAQSRTDNSLLLTLLQLVTGCLVDLLHSRFTVDRFNNLILYDIRFEANVQKEQKEEEEDEVDESVAETDVSPEMEGVASALERMIQIEPDCVYWLCHILTKGEHVGLPSLPIDRKMCFAL